LDSKGNLVRDSKGRPVFYSNNKIVGKAFGKALKTNMGLKVLDLSRNEIGSTGAKYLAQGLAVNTALETLGFQNCKIGEVGARHIAEALRNNKSLKKLKLGGNILQLKGLRDIISALETNTTLEDLQFHGQMRDQGAQILGDFLAKNKVLVTLDLSYSKIENTGIAALADGLKNNTTLKHLMLYSQKSVEGLIDKDAYKLANALRENTTLESLHLQTSSFTKSGIKAILKALRKNKTLKFLNLGDVLEDRNWIDGVKREFGDRVNIKEAEYDY
jgi:NLR family CARD domain-containing protein 3